MRTAFRKKRSFEIFRHNVALGVKFVDAVQVILEQSDFADRLALLRIMSGFEELVFVFDQHVDSLPAEVRVAVF